MCCYHAVFLPFLKTFFTSSKFRFASCYPERPLFGPAYYINRVRMFFITIFSYKFCKKKSFSYFPFPHFM
jgi:hypothetical protein